MKKTREQLRKRRQLRGRQKISGVPARPRLSIRRTARHIHAQIVDDTQGMTLVAATTDTKANSKETRKNCANLAHAKLIGAEIAEKAKAKGVTKVVFDRGGGVYHGVLKALADAAREAGLDF